MIIRPAHRTESVQEYYFSRKLKEIDGMNAEREAAGQDRVINLGIGAPDGMPPAEAIEALKSSASMPGNHAYQSYTGIPQLRKAFAGWYERYYGVTLDPSKEIQPLAGSKEGILLISLAFLNKGDKVLVPDPGYPTYSSATALAEARLVPYDLKADNGWQPDFEALEKTDLEVVKIMWTNYPNMPTGAPATMELYTRLVDFGRRHGILICNDNPYSFILNDHPLSILSDTCSPKEASDSGDNSLLSGEILPHRNMPLLAWSYPAPTISNIRPASSLRLPYSSFNALNHSGPLAKAATAASCRGLNIPESIWLFTFNI